MVLCPMTLVHYLFYQLEPKAHLSKLSIFEGFRPVSLISIISKVLEVCLHKNLSSIVITDDLQFGFTAGKGCQKAFMVLNTVLNYFNDRSNNVFAAGLDVSKAFDYIDHYRI